MSKIESYRPSNGTEGEYFHEGFCYRCAKFPHSSDAKNQCMIFLSAHAYGLGEPEYHKQWRYVDGKPTCTSFKDREEFNASRRSKRRHGVIARDTDTLDLFSDPLASEQV